MRTMQKKFDQTFRKEFLVELFPKEDDKRKFLVELFPKEDDKRKFLVELFPKKVRWRL